MDAATLNLVLRVLPYVVVVVFLGALALFWSHLIRVFGVVFVPETAVGLVNKRFVLVGKNKTLPDGSLVALNGEAGLQADTLAPGIHFGFWPWQYGITLQPFVTIPQGQIGIVEARDGKAMKSGRVLAHDVACDTYQSARLFLQHGGERGPQISIIPPGTYRINTALFSLKSTPMFEVPDNMIGVVTTKDGVPLPTGAIAGGEKAGHDMFQNGEAFIQAGGSKGLQEQVLLAGSYFINPMFATIQVLEMTQVPIASVGVVISYVGEYGEDVTGESFKHGNLVHKGKKGVWIEPLDPGRYPINPFAMRVEIVPTANVVLNWATGKTESHQLDKNLCTITVRSSDGFTFNLDVSQIIHVPRVEAPKVIARFGNMANLVTQVLEPTIGNYFRNAAQGSDAIAFLRSRKERQADAKGQITAALEDYNVVAVDTLIGDITPPEALMKTLTDRKLAAEQKTTFETQKLAQETRKDLQQAQAMADTQPQVVTAERTVQIKEFEASAAVKAADGSMRARKLVAEGEAYATQINGAAEAEKTLKVGTAEADVIKLKIASMEAGNYASIQVAEALAQSGKLVPEVLVSGNGGNGSGGDGSLVSVLLAGLIRDSITTKKAPVVSSEHPPKA